MFQTNWCKCITQVISIISKTLQLVQLVNWSISHLTFLFFDIYEKSKVVACEDLMSCKLLLLHNHDL